MGPTPERALSPREFVEECWAFKQDHAPRGLFRQRLIAGECSPTELRRWAKDAYYYTASATPNIAAWLALAPIVPDRSIFRAIARNLAGELGYIREAAHVDLYEQFLDGLGISVAGSRRPCRSRPRSVRPRPCGSSAGRPSRRASAPSGSWS